MTPCFPIFVTTASRKKELDRARNVYLADHIYGSDSQSTLARRYGWGLVVGHSVEDIESWPSRLEKVTVEDVARVARKYLDVKQSVTGVLVPAEKTKKRTQKADDEKRKS